MKARKYNFKKLLKASDDDIAKTLDSLFRRSTDYFERSIWNSPDRKIDRTHNTGTSILIKLWDWDDVYKVVISEHTITLMHDNKFHGIIVKELLKNPEPKSIS